MEIFSSKVTLIKYSGNIFRELHDLGSQPRSDEMTLWRHSVNNNKDEGGAPMTDFVKYQRHLTRLHRNGECLFLY